MTSTSFGNNKYTQKDHNIIISCLFLFPGLTHIQTQAHTYFAMGLWNCVYIPAVMCSDWAESQAERKRNYTK